MTSLLLLFSALGALLCLLVCLDDQTNDASEDGNYVRVRTDKKRH